MCIRDRPTLLLHISHSPMLKEALVPQKERSETHAKDYDRCHGNEMTLMERREAKLTWMHPHYRPHSSLVSAGPLRYEPIRMSAKMADVRSEETLAYGKYRPRTGGVAGKLYDNARTLNTHFEDRIQTMLQRQKDDEDALTGKSRRKRRWWHRYQDIESNDPLKSLRFNNLKINPISELMNTKDVVNLQLTGCRLGDEAMTWVSAFLQQSYSCLLYTSDAADEEDSVDLGGVQILKKKKTYRERVYNIQQNIIL
eukprot:TRINITY_DN8042_c0_g1_i1.p1 TRINITY_DN8042_c0_g1~~TRINITY_DN8042_c0_g1_i1.p1  ORF type:complete len:254 (-),score=27.51 TRINITY_DN8042_c0_g1_i1:8-769(-)